MQALTLLLDHHPCHPHGCVGGHLDGTKSAPREAFLPQLGGAIWSRSIYTLAASSRTAHHVLRITSWGIIAFSAHIR